MVYKGVCINKGKTVEQDEAFAYALADLMSNEELQREFKKWIFDWLKNDKKFQKEFNKKVKENELKLHPKKKNKFIMFLSKIFN